MSPVAVGVLYPQYPDGVHFFVALYAPMGYYEDMSKQYFTVIEAPAYTAKAKKLLTESQRVEIITLVAREPEIGEIMAGTGGVRKFRYASSPGKGKSGGARVIYLALMGKGRIYLLDVFAKNVKENVSKAERNEFEKIAGMMKGEDA
jgi:hypothetical protein